MPRPPHYQVPPVPPHEHRPPHERDWHEPTHGEMIELIERRFDEVHEKLEELKRRFR
jgi:hypothetical protein